MKWTEGQMDKLADAVRGFVDRKLAPLETEVAQLKAREQTHFETIEALMQRIEVLEQKLGQKSTAVRLLKADNRCSRRPASLSPSLIRPTSSNLATT